MKKLTEPPKPVACPHCQRESHCVSYAIADQKIGDFYVVKFIVYACFTHGRFMFDDAGGAYAVVDA